MFFHYIKSSINVLKCTFKNFHSLCNASELFCTYLQAKKQSYIYYFQYKTFCGKQPRAIKECLRELEHSQTDGQVELINTFQLCWKVLNPRSRILSCHSINRPHNKNKNIKLCSKFLCKLSRGGFQRLIQLKYLYT